MDERERSRLALFLVEAGEVLLPHIDDPAVGVDTRGIDGDTPLHLAAQQGDAEMVRLLIEAGAEVDAQGDLCVTPLYQGVMEGHVAVARRLLESGADPDAPNELNVTPRQRAERSDDPLMRRLFTMARGA